MVRMSANPKEPTAVALRKSDVAMGERGFALDNLDAAIRFADGLVKAGMVPKGVQHPGAVVGLIEAGKELGLAPMYALSNLTFTNGRLGIMGDAAKALIRARGALKPGTDFEDVYAGEPFTASWTCTVTAHRDGQAKPFESSFSIAEAVTAGLIRLKDAKVETFKRDGGWGDHSAPWTKYTKRMLMYRALGFLVRDRFSDILGGAVLTEELRDYHNAEVAIEPPAEPDPLLADAQPSEPLPDVIDAEVSEPSIQKDSGAPTSAAEPSRQTKSLDDGAAASATTAAVPDVPSLDEEKYIRDVERFENAMAIAETKKSLDKAWRDGQPLVKMMAPTSALRASKLYEQLRSNFK
jgi:hypothetical protein